MLSAIAVLVASSGTVADTHTCTYRPFATLSWGTGRLHRAFVHYGLISKLSEKADPVYI